jgi:DNA-binding XRE family transcriptional regulator
VRSPLAGAIRTARQAAGLTQDALGQRIRLKGRAIYRWERDDCRPNRFSRRQLLQAIAMENKDAAAKLEAVFARLGKRGVLSQVPAALPASAPVPQPVVPRAVVELGVFTMADELDLPARRVRGSLVRLVRRMREAGLPMEVVQRELEGWINSGA